jgi:hypothetical protein
MAQFMHRHSLNYTWRCSRTQSVSEVDRKVKQWKAAAAQAADPEAVAAKQVKWEDHTWPQA